VVIRNTEIKLSTEKFGSDTVNVMEGFMTSREYRGGLTDHRVRVGSREIVVTSHRFCPMIHVDGDGGNIFLHVDKSAISLIVHHKDSGSWSAKT